MKSSFFLPPGSTDVLSPSSSRGRRTSVSGFENRTREQQQSSSHLKQHFNIITLHALNLFNRDFLSGRGGVALLSLLLFLFGGRVFLFKGSTAPAAAAPFLFIWAKINNKTKKKKVRGLLVYQRAPRSPKIIDVEKSLAGPVCVWHTI